MKFGIIGYGKMGKIRHSVIEKLPNYEGAILCDPFAKDFPSKESVVENYRDILNDKSVGAVFIAVPNYLITQYVIESLDAGKHVFCEKPPGITAAEVEKMRDAEKRNPKLKLMFGFNHRHHDSLIEAKKLVDSGQYGGLLWIRGRYGKSVPPNFHSDWRSQKKYAGGGIFLDQGIHMLDLFLMMCGDFDDVKAVVSNVFWKSDIEDNVFATFTNKAGQVANLHSTMTQWRHLFSMEMFLERGYITINGLLTSSGSYGEEEMTIAENRSVAPAAIWTKEKKVKFTVDSSWNTEINIFMDAINNDRRVPVANSDDALRLMKLVDKVYAQK